jgi:hypothetical protein
LEIPAFSNYLGRLNIKIPMKHVLIVLLILMPVYLLAQDFRFNGKSSKTETKIFMVGEDQPIESSEDEKKVEIKFDGQQLSIGKDTFKYIWHQNSRDMETIQLNCIERVEEGSYPYIDAKFEIVFLDSDHLRITRFKQETPTSLKNITYSVDIKRTSN